MRLVTFQVGPRISLGLLTEGGKGLVDLAAVDPDLPRQMRDLIADQAALARVRAIGDEVSQGQPRPGSPQPTLALDSVRLAPPVPNPSKILCVGYNYRGHSAVGATGDPEFPDIFAKTPNCLIGPSDTVELPRASTEVDYEGELAVIIGRPGREIPTEHASQHIGGFCLFNDVSARDWQRRSAPWLLGKSFDSFGVLGPALVTPDEVGDLNNLTLTVRLNGVETVRASTGTMIFSIPFLISYISQVMTLEAGDVISTGTPQKLPEALAKPRFMRHGDEVAISIDTVGTLTSRFSDPTAA